MSRTIGTGRMKLFGEPGWGSAIVEAQLDWYGFEYDFERVGDLFKSPSRIAATPHRPESAGADSDVGTRDGTVMTESAAITLYLADLTGTDTLVPSGKAPLVRVPSLVRCSSLRTSIRLIPTPTIRRGSSTVSDAPQELQNAVDHLCAKALFDARRRGSGAVVPRRALLRPRHLCLRDEPLAAERPWFAASARRLFAIARAPKVSIGFEDVWRRTCRWVAAASRRQLLAAYPRAAAAIDFTRSRSTSVSSGFHRSKISTTRSSSLSLRASCSIVSSKISVSPTCQRRSSKPTR